MKCILIVLNGKERIQRSCDCPDAVATKDELRAFLQSQDLRLDAVDFVYTISFAETAADTGAASREEVTLGADADVQALLVRAAKLQKTHAITFEVTIVGQPASPRDLGSFISAEYGVDNDLVTLHVYPPPATPSSRSGGGGPSYQEKMFIIPTRLALASLVRAVEDTLSITPTRSGVRLVLYAMPLAGNDERVELSDDAAAVQLLRDHAARRAPVRLTYATQARASQPASRQMSRRASRQLTPEPQACSAPPTPAPASSPAAPGPSPASAPPSAAASHARPKANPPPLSTFSSGPTTPATAAEPKPPSAAAPPPTAPPPAASPAPTSPPAAAAAPPPPQQKAAKASPPPPAPSTSKAAAAAPAAAAASTPASAASSSPAAAQSKPATPAPRQQQTATPSPRTSSPPKQNGTAAAASAAGSVGHTPAAAPSPAQLEMRVQVRAFDADVAAAVEFRFRYTKEPEEALCKRFAAACESALGAAGGRHVPLLSSDVTVRLDTNSVLREWLALAKESQQPLRVRLSAPAATPSAPTANVTPVVSSTDSKKQPLPTGPPTQQQQQQQAPPKPAAKTPVSNGDARANGTAGAGAAPAASNGQRTAAAAASPSAPPATPTPPQSKGDAATPPARPPAAAAVAAEPSGASPQPSAATQGVQTPASATAASAAEADAPPVVMCTTAGATAPSTRLRCVCLDPEDGDGGGRSARFQISARWGSEQRLLQCRLGASQDLHELCAAVGRAFGVADGAETVMEVRFIAGGQTQCVELAAEAQLRDLRAELHVDAAELHITSPPQPPVASPSGAGADAGTADAAAGEAERTAAAPVPSEVVHTLAALVEELMSDAASPSTAAVGELIRARVGEKSAAAAPFSGFFSVLLATPMPPADAACAQAVGSQASARGALLAWLAGVLANTPAASPAAVADMAGEIAASLLRARVCDADFVLRQLADSVVVASGGAVVRPSLAALWVDAGLVAPSPAAPGAAWNPFTAAYVGGPLGWRAAYAAAPAEVLDLIAAGCMDGAWAFSRRDAAHSHVVCIRALAAAQRECCSAINPSELERYLKSGDGGAADSSPTEHRRVVLSCVGALLAPPSTGVCNYADWLVQHFRGKVATVLYTKMMDFAGASALSAAAVAQLAWTLLHPRLDVDTPTVAAAAASSSLLARLHAWALVAVQRVCEHHQQRFPPCPLLHVHTASPTPLMGCTPSVSAGPAAAGHADGPASNGHAGAKSRVGAPPSPASDAADVAAPLAPSPPSAAAPQHVMPRRVWPRKLQYEYKYNFNTFHRPRSSKE